MLTTKIGLRFLLTVASYSLTLIVLTSINYIWLPLMAIIFMTTNTVTLIALADAVFKKIYVTK